MRRMSSRSSNGGYPAAGADSGLPADWAVVSEGDQSAHIPTTIPVLPVREVVVLPGTVTPLVFGREKSLRALRRARGEDALALLVAQREPEEPLKYVKNHQ